MKVYFIYILVSGNCWDSDHKKTSGMDSSMKLYWSLYFENFSTQKLIEGNCLIKSYKYDLIHGPIIDIGCGQSKDLLAFINSDRQIFAVDNEQLQLDYLKQRVLEKKNLLIIGTF